MAQNKLVRDFFEDYIESGKDAAKVEGAIEVLKDNIARTQKLVDIYDQIRIYDGPANDLRGMIHAWSEALVEAEKALAKLKAKETEFSNAAKDIIEDNFGQPIK